MGKQKIGKPQKGAKGAKGAKAALGTPGTPGDLEPVASIRLTTSSVRDDDTLGYRTRVLLYDLQNIAKDASSEKRLNLTTDEHYISAPYFCPDQAAMVKAALVDVDLSNHMDPTNASYACEYEGSTDENSSEEISSLSSRLRNQPLDAAIRAMLDNFLEKRKASGDARPCGPHDLAPVYAALFGIDLAELQNDKFLGRLRRAGV